MIKFRDFKEPPYSTCEMSIVLHAIGNLTSQEVDLPKRGIATMQVAEEANRLSRELGIPANANGNFSSISFQVQDIIDKHVSNGTFTLDALNEECQNESELYPPVFYPPMQ